VHLARHFSCIAWVCLRFCRRGAGSSRRFALVLLHEEPCVRSSTAVNADVRDSVPVNINTIWFVTGLDAGGEASGRVDDRASASRAITHPSIGRGATASHPIVQPGRFAATLAATALPFTRARRRRPRAHSTDLDCFVCEGFPRSASRTQGNRCQFQGVRGVMADMTTSFAPRRG